MDFSSTSSSSSQQQQKQVLLRDDKPGEEPCSVSSDCSHSLHNANATMELMDRSPEQESVEKEHMFDKVVTPSDVGKLNRLVIPKQHAEKYFPLDSSTSDKGLLLNFEDRSGKSWRFRYSYWNSSQSYVMTKGWSRFVKEKKLDAGDVVSFQRGVGEVGKDKFFIDWRRRPDAPPLLHHLPLPPPHHEPPFLSQGFNFNLSFQHRSAIPSTWGTVTPLFIRPHLLPPSMIPPQYSSLGHHSYHHQHHPYASYNSHYHQPGAPQAQPQRQTQEPPMVFESVPVVQGNGRGKGKAAAAKRLRLFGVNMDCAVPQADDCDVLSYTTTTTASAATSSNTITPSDPSFHLRLCNDDSAAPPNPQAAKGKSSSTSSSMSLDFDI